MSLTKTDVRPRWFPDWRGRAVAIVASGPSMSKADAAMLEGRITTLAIKENSDICRWAECVYGCDRMWWRNELGLPWYNGLKVTAATNLGGDYPDIKIVDIDPHSDDILPVEDGRIGAGGNSGFQALNLAVWFGATRIVLLGFDMDDRAGVHWYGRNSGMGRSNPGEWNFRRWRVAFERSGPTLARMGVEVINASRWTTIKCFPKKTVAQTLELWGL